MILGNCTIEKCIGRQILKPTVILKAHQSTSNQANKVILGSAVIKKYFGFWNDKKLFWSSGMIKEYLLMVIAASLNAIPDSVRKFL